MGLPDAGHPAIGDVADDAGSGSGRLIRAAPGHRCPTTVPNARPPYTRPAPMARVCHSCGKRPAFGQSRSHSMVATKRRFDANLQKVRISEGGAPMARLRLHALPQGRQDHQGVGLPPPRPPNTPPTPPPRIQGGRPGDGP